MKELSDGVGYTVGSEQLLGAAAPGEGSSASAQQPSGATVKPETVADLQDLGLQARKVGFTEGAVVASKKAEALVLHRIVAIDADNVQLGELSDGQVVRETSLATTELLESWRLHKGKVTSALPGWDPAGGASSPLQSASWAADVVKGAVALAFQQRLAEHSEADAHLEILINPTAVKVKAAMPKGTLVLVGASPKVDKAKPSGLSSGAAVGVGCFALPGAPAGVHFQVVSHFVPPLTPNGEPSKQPWVVPFWCVTLVADSGSANMELAFFQTTIGDFEVFVPYLVNKTALQAGDRLSWWKDGAKRTPPKPKAIAAKASAAKRPKTS